MPDTDNYFTDVVLRMSDRYRDLLEGSKDTKTDPFMMTTRTPAQVAKQQERELRAMYGDDVMNKVMEGRNGTV